MNRHNLSLAWHAATDMVMIANSSNYFISQGWLASIAEGDSIINATLLYNFTSAPFKVQGYFVPFKNSAISDDLNLRKTYGLIECSNPHLSINS